MTREIARRLIGGRWRTVDVDESSNGGSQPYAAGTDRLVCSLSGMQITQAAGPQVIDWTGSTKFQAGTAIAVVGAEITFVEAGCYSVHIQLPHGVKDDPAQSVSVQARLALALSGTEWADGSDASHSAGLNPEVVALVASYVYCHNAGDHIVASLSVPAPTNGIAETIFATVVKLSEVPAGNEFA